MSEEIPKMGVEYLNRVEPWGTELKGNAIMLEAEILELLGAEKYNDLGTLPAATVLDGIAMAMKQCILLSDLPLPPMLKDQAS